VLWWFFELARRSLARIALDELAQRCKRQEHVTEVLCHYFLYVLQEFFHLMLLEISLCLDRNLAEDCFAVNRKHNIERSMASINRSARNSPSLPR
jgi:hypothetical protein